MQKEVIQATLADDFGIDVDFRETTTICIERPVGTGAAVEIIGKEPNPFLATVGLRVEPAPIGTGVEFRLEVELGSMPLAFFKAVEETVHETLRQGLHGWQVTDCTVTMTHSGYWPRQSHAHGAFDKSMSSTAGDFRNLTPLVLMDALQQAGTRVYEPMHRFRLELPADTLGAVLPVLARLRRRAADHRPSQGASCVLEGEIPAARVHELQQQLPALTRGEGVLETRLRPLPSRSAARSRPGPGPTTTRSTARSTCCTSCGGSAGEAVSRPRRPRGPCTSRSSRRPGGAAWAGCSGGTWRRSAPAAWSWPPGGSVSSTSTSSSSERALRSSSILSHLQLGRAGRPRHGMPGRPTDKWTG